jgi:hypothetical protein
VGSPVFRLCFHGGRDSAAFGVAVAVTTLAYTWAAHRVELLAGREVRSGGSRALPLALLIAGLTAALSFALLPIPMLDGLTLIRWSRPAWFAVFPFTAFSFVYLTITETTEPTPWDEILKMAAVFAVFGVVSVIAWSVVRQRVEARRRDEDYAGMRE